jgi:hypothetical protein
MMNDAAEKADSVETRTQTRGGARQEIRRSELDGARAGEETAATEMLDSSGEGGAGTQE